MNPIELEIKSIMDRLSDNDFTLYEKQAIINGLKKQITKEIKDNVEESIMEFADNIKH